jgi:hypothetical protein
VLLDEVQPLIGVLELVVLRGRAGEGGAGGKKAGLDGRGSQSTHIFEPRAPLRKAPLIAMHAAAAAAPSVSAPSSPPPHLLGASEHSHGHPSLAADPEGQVAGLPLLVHNLLAPLVAALPSVPKGRALILIVLVTAWKRRGKGGERARRGTHTFEPLRDTGGKQREGRGKREESMRHPPERQMATAPLVVFADPSMPLRIFLCRPRMASSPRPLNLSPMDTPGMWPYTSSTGVWAALRALKACMSGLNCPWETVQAFVSEVAFLGG